MGATAAIATAVIGGVGVASSMDAARRATHTAQDEAKAQREALAKLQAVPTPEMPIADSVQTDMAMRRSITTQMARRGRASTLLTDNPDALGGG